ncbi:hypothetical protein K2173_015424 [Erythroxylum novogranatense]|uniref:40S ribosomal protein S7 n=1 Tax=Erythroxylum novogranatense TaxID=1862640 RepID=A0AAV8SRJ4_9ROSI|nr:hypothetical protein K2173_015424 [Erythroxylum novogranatense]
MFTMKQKIHINKDAEPTYFEESVAQQLKLMSLETAIVAIHVPYRLGKAYRKIHVRLVRELEKKFSSKKGFSVQRHRNHTLTAMHEALLDVILPVEIVGECIRYRIEWSNYEYKWETFYAVYEKLAGKDVFEYCSNFMIYSVQTNSCGVVA